MSTEIEAYAATHLAQFREGGALETEQDYRTVEAVARECSIMIKDAEAQIAPEIKQAHQLHKALVQKRNAIKAPLEAVKTVASKLMGAYNVRKEADARAEQQRLAVEARKVATAEAKIKALDLVDAGEVGAAVAIVEHAKNAPAELLVEKPDLKPVNHGTITRTTYPFTVDDAAKVPQKYLIVDQKMLRSDINKAKGKIKIPGVTITSETNTYTT